LIIAAAPLVLAVAACGSFVLRKRLNLVGPFSLVAIVVAFVLMLLIPPDASGMLLDLELRASGLGRLASGVILATLFLLVLDVWLDEPAYNFFPTALAVGATSLGVLLLTAPLAIFGLLAYGFFRFATATLPEYSAPPEWRLQETVEPLGILLVLRAFASGSVALTGVEAVSNGVPAFKRPESRNAAVVLILMGSFFGAIFLGMSFLAGQLGIVPDPTEQETVVSQLTRAFVGNGTPYHYLVQISTALLLVLAANTAFADFPRLGSILARDRFAPHYFQFRGDRLAFTTGIVVLALLAAVLIVAFGGSVTALIPLYTVGVFVAFTLSQAGMVRHWWKLRATERGWRWRAGLNGLGAVATAVVALVVGTVLNVINQGDAMLAGGPIDWTKLLLTFAVPYCVSTYGAVSYHLKTSHNPNAGKPRGELC